MEYYKWGATIEDVKPRSDQELKKQVKEMIKIELDNHIPNSLESDVLLDYLSKLI